MKPESEGPGYAGMTVRVLAALLVLLSLSLTGSETPGAAELVLQLLIS
jgi:hypothetical protein